MPIEIGEAIFRYPVKQGEQLEVAKLGGTAWGDRRLAFRRMDDYSGPWLSAASFPTRLVAPRRREDGAPGPADARTPDGESCLSSGRTRHGGRTSVPAPVQMMKLSWHLR
jgi:hypothetical protein